MSHSLLEAFPRPALLINPDGRLGAANAQARQLFGETCVGRHYVTALRQPALLDAIDKVLAEKAGVDARFLTTDARRDITYLAHCAPVQPDGGILVTFEDHTALEEAGQIRRDFVANVSHELKTPLTALMGFLETLRGAARDDAPSRDRFLGIMQKEAERMNRLVGDLLSLSRLEAQERVRPKDPVVLYDVARSVVTSLAPLAAETGVGITLAEGAEGLTVPGDQDQLAQVLTNLLENAIKYSGKGAEVTISLTREAEQPLMRGEAVILSVSDTGPGIDSIHIPRLTERFYRIDGHRSRELGGTGLGLAIVKHIVNRHRGRLRIESEPGQGSRFSVILPVSV
jgi:two-component system phosphate regulon sensor histidine kinase PhoR